MKEWELNANKANSAIPSGSKKAPPMEKPPMFAFCMKPRGLEAPNKGSKQRSHKKMSVSGHNHAVYGGDHDGIHAFVTSFPFLSSSKLLVLLMFVLILSPR